MALRFACGQLTLSSGHNYCIHLQSHMSWMQWKITTWSFVSLLWLSSLPDIATRQADSRQGFPPRPSPHGSRSGSRSSSLASSRSSSRRTTPRGSVPDLGGVVGTSAGVRQGSAASSRSSSQASRHWEENHFLTGCEFFHINYFVSFLSVAQFSIRSYLKFWLIVECKPFLTFWHWLTESCENVRVMCIIRVCVCVCVCVYETLRGKQRAGKEKKKGNVWPSTDVWWTLYTQKQTFSKPLPRCSIPSLIAQVLYVANSCNASSY